jgi:ribonuclease HII
MLYYDHLFPQYGFARHKGYGTIVHRQALTRYGSSPLHRQTFTYKAVE